MPAPSIVNEYPIELMPPDIQAYAKGNFGLPYVMAFDSGYSGPHIMISALVHGNELCGAIALDWLLQNSVQPLKGKLTLVFANVAAFEQFDSADPFASRYVDQDFNRVWSEQQLDSKNVSVELTRARELRPLIATVDRLFDIHSMQSSSPPMMICGPHAKGRDFAREVGVPELVVADKGHSEGTRMRDFGAFADKDSEKNALLIECGQHWDKSAAELAIDSCLRLLRTQGIVDQRFGGDRAQSITIRQKLVEVTEAVTILSDLFKFTQAFVGGEIIEKQGTVIGFDGDNPVKTPYDDCVLIMPTKRTYKGQTAVRLGRFVN